MPHGSNLQLGSVATNYESEAKQAFPGATANQADRFESKQIRDKYIKGDNLHFGQTYKDQHQTQATGRDTGIQAAQANISAAKA